MSLTDKKTFCVSFESLTLGRLFITVSVVKMKTYYRAEFSKIEDQEQEQLAEIQRWVNFWKLQLSEIKACFED